ncbi:MAG: pyridoxamine 5'-phosphate oxidase [Candidatus Baltobacteraceae bacterium]
MSDLSSSRTSYERGELRESELGADPILALTRWLDEAYAMPERVAEPNAMALATVAADGRPSLRIVLLRGLDQRGLRFFTSYDSRKGRELLARPFAAATFWWAALERQVRVEGDVRRVDEDESDLYFASRPRGHRLAAWASEQSEPVESRAVLDERMAHFEERFADEEIERPHSWGGFLIVPRAMEFWQGRANRMHDRLLYRREREDWVRVRLQP